MKPRQPAFMHGAKFRGIHFPKIRRRNERNVNSNPFLSVIDGRGFLFFLGICSLNINQGE